MQTHYLKTMLSVENLYLEENTCVAMKVLLQ